MGLNNKKPTKSGALTAKDWLDIAEYELSKHGISAVRVEALAKKIGVTKGSFYWHFSDRKDLFERLLTRWRDRSTNAIIERLNDANLTHKERLKELFLLPHKQNSRVDGGALESAIRAWAQDDKTVNQTLYVVDNHRLAFISDIFEKLGYDEYESELKASLFYYTLQGMAAVDFNKNNAHIEKIFEMLL